MTAHENVRILNTIGAVAGFVGSAILFKWGLPAPEFRVGGIIADGPEIDREQAEADAKKRKTELLARLGFALIAIGFVFQLLGGWAE